MPLLADRYETGPVLGAGGMGRVVAAHDHRLDRPVAVKLIRDELLADDAARQRLLREARAAAQLHHPHTVAVFDAGEQDGRPFVVMELVEGSSLADRLRADGPLSATEATDVTAAVLDALAAAHDQGLVHRDVKPSNVLLPDAGGVKLADFGIAVDLRANTTLTDLGQVLGSPRYLAPERATGQTAAPASDVYSAGVMLFEMLAGRAPFDGDNAVATLLAHQQQPVPPLARIAESVPPQLASVAERALAKDPSQRFASARSMHDALLGAADEAGCHPEAGVAASSPATTGPIALSAATAETASAAVPGPMAPDAVPADTGPPVAGPTGPGGDDPLVDHPDDADGARRTHWLLPVGAGIALLGLVMAVLQPSGDTEVAANHHGVIATPSVSTQALGSDASEALVPVVEQPDRADTDDDDDSSDDGGGTPESGEEAGDPDDPGDPGDAAGQDADRSDAQAPADEQPSPPFSTAVATELLDDLIARLAHDPQAAGPAADDLLDGLRELRDEDDPEPRRRDARELLIEVAGYHRDVALDDDVVRTAAAVLEALGRPDDPRLHDVSWLLAQTAADRSASGDRVGHLLSDLDHLLGREDPDKVARTAERLSDQVRRWVDDGRLGATLGKRTRDVLAPLT